MVISNINHTKRCSSRCEDFNGYKTECPYRTPLNESHSKYLYRMHRTRSDQSYHPMEMFGKCGKDEIVTRGEKYPQTRKSRVRGAM